VIAGKRCPLSIPYSLEGATSRGFCSRFVKNFDKRLYFLVQLKRAKLPCKDLVLFYITCIRSILTYAVPVFHYALPMYLQRELERVQERALSIICAGLDYKQALDVAGIPTIVSYNEGICNSTFTSIITNKEHRLNSLLPAINHNPYSSREHRCFAIPKWRTNRFRNTFIMSSCIKNNVSTSTKL